jgi:phospholipid/cholesterol/gamma-HCH transport system substrate-binding protein
LRTFATATQPAVPDLDALLREVDPAVQYLAPFSREFGFFFGDNSYVDTARDAEGHYARVFGVVDQRDFSGYTPQMQQVVNALIAAGDLQTLKAQGSNSYPAAGTAGHPHPFSGTYPHVVARSG